MYLEKRFKTHFSQIYIAELPQLFSAHSNGRLMSLDKNPLTLLGWYLYCNQGELFCFLFVFCLVPALFAELANALKGVGRKCVCVEAGYNRDILI